MSDDKTELIEKISSLFFTYVPCNKLPECCIKKVEQNCKEYGGCGEVIFESIKEALTEGLK